MSLLKLFDKLVDKGNTYNNRGIIRTMKQSDYISIGRTATAGGEVVFTGTPLEMIEHSHDNREYLRSRFKKPREIFSPRLFILIY